MQNANFSIFKSLIRKGTQCDFRFLEGCQVTHFYRHRWNKPQDVKRYTRYVCACLKTARVKASHHVARFQRHHCLSTAAVHPLCSTLTCSAVAGTAIQGTTSTTILLYVTHFPLSLTASLPSADLPNCNSTVALPASFDCTVRLLFLAWL